MTLPISATVGAYVLVAAGLNLTAPSPAIIDQHYRQEVADLQAVVTATRSAPSGRTTVAVNTGLAATGNIWAMRAVAACAGAPECAQSMGSTVPDPTTVARYRTAANGEFIRFAAEIQHTLFGCAMIGFATDYCRELRESNQHQAQDLAAAFSLNSDQQPQIRDGL